MKKKKFVIVMTRTYSGGNLVLRLLGKLIENRGYPVKIYPYNYKFLCSSRSFFSLLIMRVKFFLKDICKKIAQKIGFKENVFGLLSKFQEKILPYVDNDTIVVYSEGVFGNPLRAKNVVRWFLFHNRFPDSPDAYGKNELVFSFREYFNDYNLNPTCRLLKLNYFNKELYRQYNFGERSGNCYIIRKGKNRPDLPKSFDGPIIDKLTEKEKVAVFNRCKYCYDYDTQTFYNTIACVCGCIPIVVMEPGKTKADYMGKGDCNFGKAYGNSPEQIEFALKTRQDRIKMLDFAESNERAVDNFIKDVNAFFGNW